LRKLIKKSISPEELEALRSKIKVILHYPILLTIKWNTIIPTTAITMIFVIDLGIMQLYPIHELCFKKNGCQYADGGFGDLKPHFMCHRKWSPVRLMFILEEENRARNNLIIKKNQFSHFQNEAAARKRQTHKRNRVTYA
jgi:hypothetical protein